MVARSVSYGALELKRVAHRYWVTGLLLSIAIHALMLGTFHLKWFDGGIDISNFPLHTPRLTQSLSGQPRLPGIVPLPPVNRATGAVRRASGTPVPVPESVADPEKTLATQEDLARSVEPQSSDGEGSGLPGVITVPETGEDIPVPFEAVEKLPVPLARVIPVYPPLAIQAGIEGRVVVRILVGKDGRVHEAAVEFSTADCLNDAALAAARAYVFTPAYMNNGPVSVWVMMPFSFRLKSK